MVQATRCVCVWGAHLSSNLVAPELLVVIPVGGSAALQLPREQKLLLRKPLVRRNDVLLDRWDCCGRATSLGSPTLDNVYDDKQPGVYRA